MDSPKLNEWIQAIGIFAVVASLIFVGLQLKQSQDIASSQAYQARADSTIEMIVSTAENPLFVSAVAKLQATNQQELTPEEEVTMRQYAIALLYMYENQYYQYINGFTPENRWLAAKNTLGNFLSGRNPIPVRPVFEAIPENWSIEFGAEVQTLIDEIDSPGDQ